MMKFFKGKQQWNPAKPLKVHHALNLAAEMIVGDIKEGITKHSQDIHGKPFADLQDATVERKMNDPKVTDPEIPLLAHGKMKEVYVRKPATMFRRVAIIGINKRDRLGASVGHQEGNPDKNLPQREWFGVSKRVIPNLQKLAKKMLKKELRYIG